GGRSARGERNRAGDPIPLTARPRDGARAQRDSQSARRSRPGADREPDRAAPRKLACTPRACGWVGRAQAACDALGPAIAEAGIRISLTAEHEFPHERSDLSHWRKRLGRQAGISPERVAHESGALRMKDWARVTVERPIGNQPEMRFTLTATTME